MTSDDALIRDTPEAQGIPSSAITRFLDACAASQVELHSLMLVRHGRVVAEGWWQPYARDRRHMLYSLSKSFTSTAAGFAVEEGLITLDDAVISYFPEELPSEVSPNLAKMRIRDLLSMSTGHDVEPRDQDTNWARTFLSKPVVHEPGTHFLYNSGATYMVSAILTKVTGMELTEYLRPRLLDPLGIRDAWWETCPRGIDCGGWGLNIKTEDIAKFGQLYLQRGQWNGVRIIPESWIDDATSKRIDNGDNPESDWNQGYGYQFWMCRHGAYRGDGAFGQFCVIMPEQDAVFVTTAGATNLQIVLTHLWDTILADMSNNVLPQDPQAHAVLAEKLSSLQLPTADGAPISKTADTVSGKTYDLDKNEDGWRSITPTFDGELCDLAIVTDQATHKLRVAGRGWSESITSLGIGTMPSALQGRVEGKYPCAISGAWNDPRSYTVKICGYESPYTITLRLNFAEDGLLTLERHANVAFGPTERPSLTGRTRA